MADIVSLVNQADSRDPLAVAFTLNSVNNLIPERQVLLTVSPNTKVLDALALMRRDGFSQLPVQEGSVVLGSFSFRSFSKAVVETLRDGVRIDSLQVADCLEPLHFARVTDELEGLLDEFDRREAVLVGSPDALLGIVTAVDALRFLYGVASPFVLMQEIELALRYVISTSVPSNEIAAFIRAGVNQEYRGDPNRLPTTIGELGFAQYISVLCSRDNYPRVEGLLGPNRTWTASRLRPLRELRNDVMHFKRKLTVEDYGVLTGTREWLLQRIRASSLRRGGR